MFMPLYKHLIQQGLSMEFPLSSAFYTLQERGVDYNAECTITPHSRMNAFIGVTL